MIDNEAFSAVRAALEGSPAADHFASIEADVGRFIQEYESLHTQVRELRNALEEPGGAEVQRRF